MRRKARTVRAERPVGDGPAVRVDGQRRGHAEVVVRLHDRGREAERIERAGSPGASARRRRRGRSGRSRSGSIHGPVAVGPAGVTSSVMATPSRGRAWPPIEWRAAPTETGRPSAAAAFSSARSASSQASPAGWAGRQCRAIGRVEAARIVELERRGRALRRGRQEADGARPPRQPPRAGRAGRPEVRTPRPPARPRPAVAAGSWQGCCPARVGAVKIFGVGTARGSAIFLPFSAPYLRKWSGREGGAPWSARGAGRRTPTTRPSAPLRRAAPGARAGPARLAAFPPSGAYIEGWLIAGPLVIPTRAPLLRPRDAGTRRRISRRPGFAGGPGGPASARSSTVRGDAYDLPGQVSMRATAEALDEVASQRPTRRISRCWEYSGSSAADSRKVSRRRWRVEGGDGWRPSG